MKMKIFKKITFLIILFSSFNEQKSLSKNDVIDFMNEYFEKVKQNNFSLIEPYYSETFYENVDKEKWEELFTKIHSTLGPLILIEVESWNINSSISTSGSGKNYKFVYNNKYENGNIKETVCLYLPNGSTKLKITKHNFTSNIF